MLLLSVKNTGFCCMCITSDKKQRSTIKKLTHSRGFIFTGTVISVNNVSNSDTENLIGLDRIKILLEDSIQGINFRDTMLIYTYREGIDCRYPVKVGVKYIFDCRYATKTVVINKYPPYLFISLCSSTTIYNRKYINKLKRFHKNNPRQHRINQSRIKFLYDEITS